MTLAALAQDPPTPVDPSTVPFPVFPVAVPPPPGVEPPATPPSEAGQTSTPPLAPPPTEAPSASTSGPPATRTVKAGDQLITLYLRGLPSGARVYATRGSEAPVVMADPGIGVLATELIGPPARFLQLRLTTEDAGSNRTDIYDGLVVLGGSDREIVAFTYQDQQALRLPVSPSGRTEVALDQRVPWWITFGWGAAVAAWLGILSVAWALKGRRG